MFRGGNISCIDFTSSFISRSTNDFFINHRLPQCPLCSVVSLLHMKTYDKTEKHLPSRLRRFFKNLLHLLCSKSEPSKNAFLWYNVSLSSLVPWSLKILSPRILFEAMSLSLIPHSHWIPHAPLHRIWHVVISMLVVPELDHHDGNPVEEMVNFTGDCTNSAALQWNEGDDLCILNCATH